MRNLVLVELADPVDLVGPPLDRVAGQPTLRLHLMAPAVVGQVAAVGLVVVLTVDLHSCSSRINGSLLIAKVLRLCSNLVAVMVALFLLAQ